MLKDYLKYLESHCKKFKKENEEIFDIVIYGSFVKGKYDFKDIDLMILLIDLSLAKRLEIAQNLKSVLKKEIKNIDIKTMNLEEFFEESFLARQGILIEGISLIRGKTVAELIGFKGFSIFTYNLKNLNHNKKIQFNYALSGRDKKGMMEILNGESLGRGVVQIPIDKSKEFEDFLNKWEINHKIKNSLESKI